MGFDCIVCGGREIWAFESKTPRVCCDCYNKQHGVKPTEPVPMGQVVVNPARAGDCSANIDAADNTQ